MNPDSVKKEADQFSNTSTFAELEKTKIENTEKANERWSRIIEASLPRVLTYFEQRMVKHDTPLLKTGLWGVITVIVLIVGSTILLVWTDKLDASVFTFVVGTVLGYLLAISKSFLPQKDSNF